MPTDHPTPPILPAAAVAEMVQRAEKATPGPWPEDYVYSAIRHLARNCDFIESEASPGFSFDKYDDSPLIQHCRTDLPALAASHEALRAAHTATADVLATTGRLWNEALLEQERLEAEIERLRDCERVAWLMERGFMFLAEVRDVAPESDHAGDLSRSWAPFIVLLEATEIDGFGWLLQLKDKNMIQDSVPVLIRHMDRAAIDAARKVADDASTIDRAKEAPGA